ncbi:hypothetical protein ACOQFV_24200 [Nocardiopsis changdeensis]|uniref:Uncharacterized protein n=1 Tax=Nocardiopsis changdeensis TaxID=2831969 RepID=A0A975KTH1_9ACTN|nr:MULTISPECIES: hypothetical protein [Nocardiopsis]QUX26503.1 hypothetical protein KGD84_32925 [Nocardiopsis changdeensis]QYX40775.1 hypothetical protein K1J57_32775 [Nocardiopsis sp. MT53]
MMLTTITKNWLSALGISEDQVHKTAHALHALEPTDLTVLVEAARSPFLGELAEVDPAGRIGAPRPISAALAASGCVFARTLHEGTRPRDHHWLSHLGWLVALYVQPGGGDWAMRPEAVDLDKALAERHSAHTGEFSLQPLATLGLLLHRTRVQLGLFHPGNDVEYWLLTRITRSVLCEVINAKVPGSPLTEGGYDDAAAAMITQAVIHAESDDDAFDLADRARMPDAYNARQRYIRSHVRS